MIKKEIFFYTLRNISKRKSRSFLTIISILFGIATIFIFISFGIGLFSYVNSFTTDSSLDKITIMPRGAGFPGLDDTFALTKSDIRAIEKTSGVYEATGLYSTVAEIKSKGTNKFVFITGFDPKTSLIFDISNIGLESGRMLDSKETGKVLLGYNYQFPDKILKEAIELNDAIEIQGENVRVVGFMEKVGNPQDDSAIYVTHEFFEELYPGKEGKFSFVIARIDVSEMGRTISSVERSLRKSRNLEEGKEDFFVSSFEDLLSTYTGALSIIVAFVILIALISVLVSAVNTANTMVTSVLERKKDIGVIKSIGAKNSEVLQMFLLESGILGLIAGIVGTLLGFVLSLLGGKILASLGWSFLKPSFPFILFLGCILFATITGAISGAWPAFQASKTRIVDALRYE